MYQLITANSNFLTSTPSLTDPSASSPPEKLTYSSTPTDTDSYYPHKLKSSWGQHDGSNAAPCGNPPPPNPEHQ